MAHPVCERLSGLLVESSKAAAAPTFRGRTLPWRWPAVFDVGRTNLYRSWKYDVIGMTNMSEAKLACEAELRYAGIAMVTEFDCWREEHGYVSVTDIVRGMHDIAEKTKPLIVHLIGKLEAMDRPPSPIDKALEHAIITASESRDPGMLTKQARLAARAWWLKS
jgi:5'-methylthioadenosine phosphorylase